MSRCPGAANPAARLSLVSIGAVGQGGLSLQRIDGGGGKAAGLVDTLKSPGPFTVFAPTDDAFAALPAGTVEKLLKSENKDQLVATLTYHVVPGEVISSDIAGQKLRATTVQDGTMAIDATSGVMVNDATVIAADVDATNGVIHVIDKVLLP